MKFKQIAIDGPAGAGKSSVAKQLAERLKYIYIDSGAMYRALSFNVLKHNINLEDTLHIINLALKTDISFKIDQDSKNQRVYCDGEDVTEAIRSPKVSEIVSVVAAIPEVREHLVKKQRELASSNDVIMDGRDIGTIVLPNANYKFFLTASLEERAKRRLLELQAQGYMVSFDSVFHDMAKRDQLDTHREIAPLEIANDGIVIDTSNLNIEQVINRLSKLVKDDGNGL